MDPTPQSIEHRCLEYHYTPYIYREKGDEPAGQLIIDALYTIPVHIYIYMREMSPPGQLSIDALHTSTPNQFDSYL